MLRILSINVLRRSSAHDMHKISPGRLACKLRPSRQAVVTLLVRVDATPPRLAFGLDARLSTISPLPETVYHAVSPQSSTVFRPRKSVCRVRRARPSFRARGTHVLFGTHSDATQLAAGGVLTVQTLQHPAPNTDPCTAPSALNECVPIISP